MTHLLVAYTGSSETIEQILPGTIIEHYSAIRIIKIETDEPAVEILSLPGVTYVEEEQETDIESFWHLNRVSTTFLPILPEALPTNGGEGTTIYLIDSAIDVTHPEFEDADIDVIWFASPELLSHDTTHGTAVASLIVGKTLGSAPKAILKSLVIPFGSIQTTVLIEALNTILEDPNRPRNSVLNCSWGIPKSALLDSKIAELQAHGILVVAAAGNSGTNADLYSPVGLDTVLGVGASDAFDRVIPWETGSSNWGVEVDITAPGIDISIATENGLYQEASGTSLAAAITSGIVAQYVAHYTDESVATIQDNVLTAAVPDVLFRNEDIYGLTPNRLIQALKNGVTSHWLLDPKVAHRRFDIQLGNRKYFDVSYKNGITKVLHTDFQTARHTIKPFSWVSVEDAPETQTAHITITPEVEGRYVIILSGFDELDRHVSSLWMWVNAYATNPEETSEEVYNLTQSGDGPVLLQPFADCCDFGCGKDIACCSQTGEIGSFVCLFEGQIPSGICC